MICELARLNERSTTCAAAYTLLPVCAARTVHTPALIGVTRPKILTVQTPVVCELNVTVKPDEAVAVTTKAPLLIR